MIADNSASDFGGGEPNLESDDWHAFEVDDGDVSMSLVYALAELEDADPCDLGFAIADYVDPEALDLLFAGRRDVDATVRLSIADYEVCITAAGRILIR